VRDHLDSSEDEGPHENLAQLAIRLYEIHQMLSLYLDDFARFSDARMNKAAPARQHVDFAREHARLKHGHEIFACS